MRPCEHCKHPASDHGDRAVTPCAIEIARPEHHTIPRYTKCFCPGYREKST